VGRELAYLNATDVVDAAGIVGVADDTVCRVVHLAGDVAEVGKEAIPLRRDTRIRSVIALAQSEDEHGVRVNDAQRGDNGRGAVVHSDWLLEVKPPKMGPFPQPVRGQAEVLAECARECFVRAVSGVERDRQDVPRPGDERPGGLAQTASADIRRERRANGEPEGAGEMEAGDADGISNRVER
jgi:hypothetical protein